MLQKGKGYGYARIIRAASPMSDDALKIQKPLIAKRFCAAEDNRGPIIVCVQRWPLRVRSGKTSCT
jgi:hypothetical protein